MQKCPFDIFRILKICIVFTRTRMRGRSSAQNAIFNKNICIWGKTIPKGWQNWLLLRLCSYISKLPTTITLSESLNRIINYRCDIAATLCQSRTKYDVGVVGIVLKVNNMTHPSERTEILILMLMKLSRGGDFQNITSNDENHIWRK